MTELQQATTDELLEELKARWPRMIFAGERSTPGEPECDDTFIRYFGGMNTAVGLSFRVARHLRRKSSQDLIDEDDDRDCD